MPVSEPISDLAFELYADWEERTHGGEHLPLDAYCLVHPECAAELEAIAAMLGGRTDPPPNENMPDSVLLEIGYGTSCGAHRGPVSDFDLRNSCDEE